LSNYYEYQGAHYRDTIDTLNEIKGEVLRLWPEDNFLITYLDGKLRQAEQLLASLQERQDIVGGRT